jgi:hypothetical protein
MRKIGVCLVAVCAVLWVAGYAFGAPRNTIAVSVPKHVKNGRVYNVTIRGFARHRDRAYLFIDYAGCATSFKAEDLRANKESDTYVVKGNFMEISGWKSSATGTDHACAYLLTRGSHQLVARARLSFEIH